ncbi:MAG: phosphatidate cytidylyltransferase [Flavobacteriales bacterium]|nr:phosphatidate cytidylyltransferase [Flavobacteriales bacterium]
MREVLIRSSTGIVYILFVVLGALAGPFTTGLLFLPVAILGALEMHRLYWHDRAGPPQYWSGITVSLLYVSIAVAPLLADWRAVHALSMSAIILFLSAGWMLFRHSEGPAIELAGTLFLMTYLAPAFAMAPTMVGADPLIFIGFMILLWTSDTGAYVFGRLIGRRPLFPSVSPKKTIEGALGGLFVTLGAAWVVWTLWPVLALEQWLVGAGLIFVTGTLGDLLESAFKRAAGVKDSGSLLPGHGGILDRFDGYLLAAPAFWAYLRALS